VFICLSEGTCHVIPAEISSEVRGAIWTHIQNCNYCRIIVQSLTDIGMTPSHTTVAKVMKQAEAEGPGVMKKAKKLGFQSLPTRKRRKVAQEVKYANPNPFFRNFSTGTDAWNIWLHVSQDNRPRL
jgi:hypothetical protein